MPLVVLPISTLHPLRTQPRIPPRLHHHLYPSLSYSNPSTFNMSKRKSKRAPHFQTWMRRRNFSELSWASSVNIQFLMS